MKIEEKISVPIEILVATQNRTDLEFLHKMFVKNNINLFHILIINQTSKKELLKSNNNKIRVINSFETGISKSRNLAIKNSIGKVCLLADDDVIYLKDFDTTILNAFKKTNADIITFKTLTNNQKPFYSNYPNNISENKKFIIRALSIEIAFRRESILNESIFFDERFGLGSQFEDGENQLFFNRVFKKKLSVIFFPNFIVMHKPETSSDDIASDRFMYARCALNHEINGLYAYLYIPKLIFALLRRRLINLKQIIPKYKIGLKGINDIKKSNKKYAL